ncbi:MAG: HAD family hydrolase [Blautia sp.]|nr:HAD family hydrolase [Blautia sp.]
MAHLFEKDYQNIYSGKTRVSFDLDEVLFVCPDTHKTEPALPFPFNKLYKERFRLGTPDLIHQLQDMGVEVWVYTSSFRSENYIKKIFRHYGVKFDGIINGQRHLREVQAGHKEILPQKLPNKYGISLHIDDESVIAIHGRTYGFKVYQLEEQDDDWKEKILECVKSIQNNPS